MKSEFAKKIILTRINKNLAMTRLFRFNDRLKFKIGLDLSLKSKPLDPKETYWSNP